MPVELQALIMNADRATRDRLDRLALDRLALAHDHPILDESASGSVRRLVPMFLGGVPGGVYARRCLDGWWACLNCARYFTRRADDRCCPDCVTHLRHGAID